MRNTWVIVLTISTVLAAAVARASADVDVYVDSSVQAGDGSKDKPLPTITQAMAEVEKAQGDGRVIVHIAAGIYAAKAKGGKEDIPPEGWAVRRPLWILGSYVTDGGKWAPRPYPNQTRKGYPTTVIDLGGSGRAFLIDAPKLKPAPRPKEECDLDPRSQRGRGGETVIPSVRLQGLAFRAGRAEGDGGAVLSRGGAPLEILNCDFEDNQCTGLGGAVCAVPTDKQTIAFYRQCVFKGNAATGADSWGGAVYSEPWTHMQNCILYGNKAAHGAACAGKDAAGWNVAFLLAYANEGDFAVNVRSQPHSPSTQIMNWWLYDGITPPTFSHFGWSWGAGEDFRVVRSTISDNAAGGICLVQPAHAESALQPPCGHGMMMRGLIVTGNRGVGILYDSGDSPVIAMYQVNDVWGNQGGDRAGGAAPGGSCRSADPLFRDSANGDLDKRDYSLKPGSPCIAWADYRSTWLDEGGGARADLGGLPLLDGWVFNDMGAYRYAPREGEPQAVRERSRTFTFHEIYVDRKWPGPYKGAADAPFRNITDAVNAIAPIRGPTAIYNIRIAEGVYDRSVEQFGDFGIDLTYEVVNFFGGYAGLQGDASSTGSGQGNFDWKTRKPRSTIVDPQGKSRAFVTGQEAMTQHRFDGLTFRNGRIAGHGGAFCVQGLRGEAAQVCFNDCLFQDNQCTGNGGAIHASTGDFPTYVTQCDFVNNQAGGSGGAVCWGDWDESLPLLIRGCRFQGNRARGDGGGMMYGTLDDRGSCERGALVEECVFTHNSAGGLGGGFCQRPRDGQHSLPPLVMRRCQLLDNDANDGGAVYVDRNMQTVLQGCVVARNGGQYAVRCRSLPAGLPNANPPWRRQSPLWEGQRLDRPDLPALFLEFCTVTGNSGGGVCYEDTNPKPVNADTPGVGATDCIFARNGGPAVADLSKPGNTQGGTVAWSLLHQNTKDTEGGVVLDVGCVQADPLLGDDFKLGKGSPAANTGRAARFYGDTDGRIVSVHPGYEMGAFGLARERSVPQGDWKSAEHLLYVDAGRQAASTSPAATDGNAQTPFQNIGQAVAAINEMERLHRWADQYVVNVAPGTYSPVEAKGDTEKPAPLSLDAKPPPQGLGEGWILQKGHVLFVGGYAAPSMDLTRSPQAESRRAEPDGQNRPRQMSVIDGQGCSRGITAAASYDVGMAFVGFVFRNCASLGGGGAIRLSGGIEFLGGVGRSGLGLTDCLFENNRSWLAGGAVHAGGNCAGFAADDCVFRLNQAGQGGAMFLVTPCYGVGLEKEVGIRRCDFDRNLARSAGGAIFTTPGRADYLVADSTFRFNTALGIPGGGWTLDLQGGGGVFQLFYPPLTCDGGHEDLVPWPFMYQISLLGQRLMPRAEQMTFRQCRFYGNESPAGKVVQAQPAFSQNERVLAWMPSWRFEDCQVDQRDWDQDFASRVYRRQGTKPFDPPEILAELGEHLRDAKDADEKRWCLDRLGRVGKLEVVERVAPFMDDPDARQVAAAAVVRIASASDVMSAGEGQKTAAKAALERALGIADAGALKTEARILLVSLARPPAIAAQAAQPPKMDGKLDDAVWAAAKPIDDFRLTGSPDVAKQPTEVRFAYDNANLYIAVRCTEPELDKLVARADKPDGETYKDDSVEIFLDLGLDRKTAVQYVINANGVVFDARNNDPNWTGPCEVKPGREKDAWTLEIAIPWKSLQVSGPRKGQRIGLNVCRNRVDAAGEHSRWIDTGAMNYQPNRFGILVCE